jgi:hypothetical protein
VGWMATGPLVEPVGPQALPITESAYNAACRHPRRQTWRHTATSRPCTLTWSAGSTIGP